MGWLCALLAAALAASWAWFLRRRRALRRRIVVLHAQARAFLNGEGNIAVDVADDELSPLHRDCSDLADEVLVAAENRREQERQTARLVADISHQLKTPLATMRLYCEMDQEDGRESAGRELLLVGRMEELIHSLLRLEKLRANAYEMEFALCDLAAIARDVCDQFAALYPHRRFAVQEGGLPARGDRAWLREAVANVIKNACEHTGENGRIDVSFWQGEGFGWIAVEDDGGGVPEEEIGGLFRRFSRLSNAETGGAGLGLAITRSILECHHGGAAAEMGRAGLRILLYMPAIAEALTDTSFG